MRKSQLIPILETLFAVVVWGASFVATKIALRSASPNTVIWVRFFIGILVLAGAVALRKQFAWPNRKDLLYFAGLGVLGITWHQWLQVTGLQTSQATTTAWIIASTPVFMALLAWAFLREKIAGLQIAGIAVAAAGVLLVVSRGDFTTLLSGKPSAVGDFLILLSAPNWAIFSTWSRRGLQRHPAARMMLFVMFFGWLFSSGLFIANAGYQELSGITAESWGAILFLGIACTGLAYVAWYDALQALPASQVGAFLYFEPFVTVVVAAVVLSEPLLWASLVGGGLILLGVWLVNRQ